jgi:hypothetical protein
MNRMEQLLAFCDWKHNPHPEGKPHIAEWAAAELERLAEEIERRRDHADDGLAFRRATTMLMTIEHGNGRVEVSCGCVSASERYSLSADSQASEADVADATRRAIVRAAAAIGGLT